jgi:hypothetical protein
MEGKMTAGERAGVPATLALRKPKAQELDRLEDEDLR